MQTQPINSASLLAEANKIIQEHEDFIHGMAVTSVEQKKGVLIFKGEYFLDEQGLPTTKSTAMFNMYKHLSHMLSEKYRLVD
ncbi:YciN family protein [Citrobacter sp. JGM124]|uniref:YciN family protein n=1 Tax=Citrobacter sp. JGM124 TaxID=2799789 RepID=UPI001BA9E2E1|nr:YciN family protein [Citrobacter sp. JGM124]MBS0847227.1 YciN family protein [Citrobacter sp. JGM124]